MRLFEATFKYLSGVAGVTSLIGSGTDCRMYELYAEQGRTTKYPICVVEEMSEEMLHQFVNVPSMAKRGLSFDCFATSPADAEALAQAIHTAIMRQEAAWTAAAGSFTVSAVLFASKNYDYFQDEETSAKVFSANVDYVVYHTI